MRTRGRPKSDQKRQQILQAAASRFAGEGYSTTSMEAIAVAAGVSKQTIYSHFENKADVLRECVKSRCEQGLLSMGSVDLSLSPREFLMQFARRFVDLLTSDEALSMYRLCLNESERHPEVGAAFYEAGPRAVAGVVAAYLEEASRRGELQVEHPEMSAIQFLFAVRGYPVDRLLLNLPSSAQLFAHDQYIESCCDSFLRAHGVP